MNDASASPSRRSVQFGTVTIADGLAAYGLIPLNDNHLAAIAARGLDAELLPRTRHLPRTRQKWPG
jgi:hypothetical protein